MSTCVRVTISQLNSFLEPRLSMYLPDTNILVLTHLSLVSDCQLSDTRRRGRFFLVECSRVLAFYGLRGELTETPESFLRDSPISLRSFRPTEDIFCIFSYDVTSHLPEDSRIELTSCVSPFSERNCIPVVGGSQIEREILIALVFSSVEKERTL